jgi:hypothetical protein
MVTTIDKTWLEGARRDASEGKKLGAAQADQLLDYIAELEALADRAVTIADEAFGLGPVEPLDDTLTRIELGIFGQRKRILQLEALIEQLRCGDLALFVDGELEARRAAAFRDHLARCEDCQDGLRDNMAIDASLSLAAKPRGRDA